jgi:hypothetical protein
MDAQAGGTIMSKIVPIHQPQIGRLRALYKLAADADRVVSRYDELENLLPIVRKKMGALKNGELIDKLLADAKRAATLSKYDVEALERCNDALELLDASENYEDGDPECDLRRNVVSARLAILIGAFPNSGSVGDPEIYTRVMVEHVFTVEGLTLIALDSACHEIVATHKFLPTTSELLKVLNGQATKWDRRLWAISSLANTSHRIVARIVALRLAKQ